MKTPFQTPQCRPSLATGPIRARASEKDKRPDHVLWLDKNENSDPHYHNFIKKIIADIPIESLYTYPDCFPLYQQSADHLQVDVNQLLIAAGADGVIRAIFETFVSPGDVVIHPEPTFLMYSLYVQIYAAKGIVLDYLASNQGPILPIAIFLEAIKEKKPRLVCLPNPGSPTGTVFSLMELREIIEAAGQVNSIVLIDETYYPFCNETVLPLINDYPHLVVCRSVSKAWGLAGIRLGYGLACKELINELHKVRARFEVGALSATIATRLLSYPDEMLASVQRLNEGKTYFLQEMQKLNLQTLNGEGNFLHVAFGKHAPAIHEVLANHVLYQKDFKHPALSGFSRFTSTTKELFVPIVDIISEVVMQNDLSTQQQRSINARY